MWVTHSVYYYVLSTHLCTRTCVLHRYKDEKIKSRSSLTGWGMSAELCEEVAESSKMQVEKDEMPPKMTRNLNCALYQQEQRED